MMRSLAADSVYVCADRGHVRRSDGFCQRCDCMLPETTLEESMAKQVAALKNELAKLQGPK